MKCAICKHGETNPGVTTITLKRDATIVIVKDVPADVCSTCGEDYLSTDVTLELEKLGNAAVARGAEVEILTYVKPAA